MNEGLVLLASWTMLGAMGAGVVWCVLRRTPADPDDRPGAGRPPEVEERS